MTGAFAVSVAEPSQVAEARRLAAGQARRLGFDETETAKAALVVTEAATNLVKHAGGGEIIVRPLLDSTAGAGGLEMLALDKGPGIGDVEAALRDGHSTAGSPGTGLGAIARQSDWFDIYAVPGLGTALIARLWPKTLADGPAQREMEVGVVQLPKRGQEVCGDAWSVAWRAAGGQFLVADGLGHGPQAATASMAAVRAFEARAGLPPGAVLEASHAALRSTRGAAVAVADVDLRQQQVVYAGVGNIVGTIYGAGNVRHMVSHSGTVGHEVHRIHEFSYPWPADGLLLLYSDGLSTHVRLEAYPGLMHRHPSLIAGVLYRDYSRGRDDVTVVVARERRAGDPR